MLVCGGRVPEMAGLDPAVPLPRQLRWLGLDLDHTLVRYHLRAAFALIYRSLCRSLCEGGHCALAELLGVGSDAVADFEAHSDIVAKGLAFDFETGDLLKLDGEGYVCLAQHGVRAPPLSPAVIRQRYGRRPWRHFAALQTEPTPEAARWSALAGEAWPHSYFNRDRTGGGRAPLNDTTQPSYRDVRDALGLTPRQASWSAFSVCLLWHLVQPLGYLLVLPFYFW